MKILLFFLISASSVLAAEPARESGLSVHMLPERVARIGGQHGGFSVTDPITKESAYQVWQEGVHPQAIVGDEMMLQKLEYLHNNPVKRGLVAAPEHWRYSSAHEWCGGVEPVLTCDDWR